MVNEHPALRFEFVAESDPLDKLGVLLRLLDLLKAALISTVMPDGQVCSFGDCLRSLAHIVEVTLDELAGQVTLVHSILLQKPRTA